MNWRSFLAFAILAAPNAQALIRFPCAQLVTQRLDPLVTPGQVSPHVHQIIGGNSFNISMDPSIDLPSASTCTTCKFKENKSNYWTAVMYFKHPNGTFTRVPQVPNHLTGTPEGGMTVYYIQPTDGSKVTAFPKGFRMISGNPFLRSKPNIDANSPQAWSTSFRCWQTSGFTDASNSSPPGAGSYDTVELPNRKCPSGIRAQIFFPACWDGKNLDSADHSSHVAFFQGRVDAGAGIILMKGTCPSTHPVRMPLLFFETVWDTGKFNNMWPTDGSQPFVLSMGDPTGYGHHGDYVFGWEGDALQRAMNTCTDLLGLPDSCRTLAQQTDAQMNQCKQQPVVFESVEGTYLNELPGCNPIQRGPGLATMPAQCNALSTTGAPQQTTIAPSPTTTQPPVTVPPPTTTVSPPNGVTVPKFGQCGGVGWTGGTTCTSGSTCQKLNDWYFQCL